MVCSEISREMASLTAKKCRKYQNVRVYPMSFEEWEPEPNSFDLVISGTAFHWLPKEVAYPKAALVLKDSGYLVFWNFHPTPYTGFFKEVQKVYRRLVPEWKDPEKERSIEDKIRAIEDEINETGLFEKAIVKRYKWTKEYTADQYVKLLNTYSDHRPLDPERRRKLFAAIKKLIEEEYGGKITDHTLRSYL